mmetsp:Transcript_39090/g.70436  ORF Transcript_39090/g.70436 Transcript_39090/m.70436 type:complete len:89 (-) Transcript_39090:535-801(-)
MPREQVSGIDEKRGTTGESHIASAPPCQDLGQGARGIAVAIQRHGTQEWRARLTRPITKAWVAASMVTSDSVRDKDSFGREPEMIASA